MTGEGFVVDTPDGIEFFQLCARRGALKLENRGLKHSSGRSVFKMVKQVYGLRGTREEVLAQLNDMIEQRIKAAKTLEGVD